MSEPHDGSQGDPSSKQGMVVVGLIGLNALCVAVLAGASLLLPRTHGATPVVTSESTSASSATASAKEEPKAAETTPASDTKAAPSAAATAAAASDSSSGGQRAVVATLSAKVRAVLHTKPDAKGPTAAMLPTGTKIEVMNKQAVGKQTWYQVKTVDFQPASTGWLHSAVVTME